MDWILYVVIVVIVIGLLITAGVLTSKYKLKKRNNNIISLFVRACENKNITDYKIEYVKKDAYDFYYEDSNTVYYVKIVNNPLNREICVNNAIKWQLRSTGASDEMCFVEGIEGLMRMDLRHSGKVQHKLYIVYPYARALMKVINECEMVFIYPDTDVYGTSIITYHALEENPDLIDV